MILRAENPYGTGHGADVPFTMGWYNNPGKFLKPWYFSLIGYPIKTSFKKIQRFFNWFSVVWVRPIGNGEKIWTISIDCNTWEIFFMMDTLTRPGLHGSIWLANDWFSQPEAKNSAKSCIGCRFWQKPETLWNLEITIHTLGQIL